MASQGARPWVASLPKGREFIQIRMRWMGRGRKGRRERPLVPSKSSHCRMESKKKKHAPASVGGHSGSRFNQVMLVDKRGSKEK